MNMWLSIDNGYGSEMYLDNGVVIEVIRNTYPGSRRASGFEYAMSTATDGLLLESWENFPTMAEAQRQALGKASEIWGSEVRGA